MPPIDPEQFVVPHDVVLQEFFVLLPPVEPEQFVVPHDVVLQELFVLLPPIEPEQFVVPHDVVLQVDPCGETRATVMGPAALSTISARAGLENPVAIRSIMLIVSRVLRMRET